ncbi:MAG: hypothetical protein P8R34_02985 [archaeon]|jgi:hypothetical protein|nr:hypothetical protein [archaeon]|tara:strand:+ start:464 stop:637 length:174 start_codon:yes stop_codon:yes gene_type:complete
MNFFPLVGVGLGLIIGYFSVRYIADKMGKPIPGIGELMFPMHHTDSKIDKRYNKGKR